jgi:nicotinamide mononucleotide (NMN) deamidase PncC
VAAASQQQLAQQVHASGVHLVLAVTGGGSGAISALLAVPGASRSILEAAVPYAPQALSRWLGGKPDEFCSARTARAMAMAAYLKANTLDPQATLAGVACTASLASDRPKRGPHRLHVGWQTAATTACASLELEKGLRNRADEETIAATLVLNAVAEACGAPGRLDIPLANSEHAERARVDAPSDEQDLLAGRTSAIPRGAARGDSPPAAVFPGAFNPPHEGHRKMIDIAKAILGCDVALEISIENVDKPPLDFIEIDERLRPLSPETPLWLTRAPIFVKKAELFPGATFIVGADTMERIGQEHYYGGPAALAAAIESIAARGCRFLVFGRVEDGRFRTLDHLRLPASLARLCQAVPENAFREDVSSTELRARGASVPDDKAS